MDAGESPVCAMDGALRAVASVLYCFSSEHLEALRFGTGIKEEYNLCNLPDTMKKSPM